MTNIGARQRFRVFARDGFRCRYCGVAVHEGAVLTIDHVVPVSAGGRHLDENLVAACRKCNDGKTDTMLPAGAPPVAPVVAQLEQELRCRLVSTGRTSVCPRCGSLARIFIIDGGAWDGDEGRVWSAPDGSDARPDGLDGHWFDLTYPGEWRPTSGCGYDSAAWLRRWGRS